MAKAAKIVGVEGMTLHDLEQELLAGGRFVVFTTCVSFIVVTAREPSSIRFLRVDDPMPTVAVLCSLATLLLGWWGIPWGPIHTVSTLGSNLRGGKVVTDEVMAQLRQRSGATAASRPG